MSAETDTIATGRVARTSDEVAARGVSKRTFALTVAALFLLIAGTELPTPLYVVYQRSFGFSNTVTTLVFAVYALVLIPALIVGGRLADRHGRLPVLVAGLLLAAVGSVVLGTAGTTAVLFAGRAIQGIAVGLATGAATAALVELAGAEQTRRMAAVWATVAVAGGGSAGPLGSGLLAQYAPAPLELSYLVEAVALLVVAAGLILLRRGFARPGAARFTGSRLPGVPRSLWRPFSLVGLTVFAVWSVGGLYTALVPSYTASLLDTHNLAVLGAVPFAMLAVATVTQLCGRGVHARPAQLVGLVLVVAGAGLMVAAFPSRSILLLAGSALLDGVGLGLGFLGAQRGLQQLTPDDRRAEIAGAFNVCLYLGVSLPVIGAGLVADQASLFVGVAGFGVLLAALAGIGIVRLIRR